MAQSTRVLVFRGTVTGEATLRGDNAGDGHMRWPQQGSTRGLLMPDIGGVADKAKDAVDGNKDGDQQ